MLRRKGQSGRVFVIFRQQVACSILVKGTFVRRLTVARTQTTVSYQELHHCGERFGVVSILSFWNFRTFFNARFRQGATSSRTRLVPVELGRERCRTSPQPNAAF